MKGSGRYFFDDFVIDASSACLLRDGAQVPLRPKSFDVLLHLVRNHGRLVTKDELFDNVWANVVVTDNSLVQCIKEVRQALGDGRQAMVETVAKRGYIFRPAVVEGDGPSSTHAGSGKLAPVADELAQFRGWVGGGRRAAAVAGFIAALLVAGGIWWMVNQPAVQQAPAEDSLTGRSVQGRLSIAVLPFGTLGEDTNDYFSIGISEDLAAALGRFPDLAVASPKVVSRFRSAGLSTDDIQRQLNVRYLVEGSIRRSAERIRITTRLTDLPRGILLWSEFYDASPIRVFAIQDDIIVRIAGALSVKLLNLEQRRAANTPPSSMEAYDFVLRGRDLLTRLN